LVVRPWLASARICVVGVTVALSIPLAAAATYKWVDANGRVVYSDQPPPASVKAETISAPPPPANPNAVKDLAAKEAELQQRRLLRADEEAKSAKKVAEADKKREQCGKMRGQLLVIQSDPTLLYQTNEKGERVLMDESARRRERAQLEGWLRENNCGS